MAAALVATIRYGQAQWRDRMFLDLGVQRGLLTSDQANTLSAALEAAGVAGVASAEGASAAEALLQQGLLSPTQLESLTSEFDVMDVMETVADASAPVAVQQANSKPGHRLGRYTLVEEIGAGGMGVVWRGWDNQLSRWVAVKQLKVRDSQLVSRFMREASMLAQLAHPNITTVYEVGVHEGQPFLVMEIVEGGSPKADSLNRKQAARVVRDAALAVAFAHDNGIVHRDLKPSNLLMNAADRVFVTDFGLARMKEEGNSLTASGAIMGTPSFMAPEQAQGKDADYRTDVYGLGATLFALVEGRPPHTGEIVHEVVKRVAVSNPPSIGGDDDLVVVALKAMERDREDRYQSAKDLADELDRFIRDEPITARKISALERLWRRAKRRPALATGIAAGVLLSAAVALWAGTELYSNYARSVAASAASIPISEAEAVSNELRKLMSNQNSDPQWVTAALVDLEKSTAAALAAAPGYSEAEYLRGMYHLWNGDLVDSEQHLSAAVLDDPNLHEARAYRAVVAYAADDAASPEVFQDTDGFRVRPPPPSAERDALIRAIEDDISHLPEDFGLRVMVESVAASARGDVAQSTTLLSKHLAAHPYDERVRGTWLWTLLAAADYPQTIQAAQAMIDRGAFVASAHAVTAFALAGLDRWDDAIAAMQRSIDLQPDADMEHWIAQWDFKQQRYNEALVRYTKIIKQHPDAVEALVGRANTLLLVSDPSQGPELVDQAGRDLDRALELQPKHDLAAFLKGNALLQSDPQSAVEFYRRALKLAPAVYARDGNAMLGAALGQLGDADGAIEHLTLAVAADPDNVSTIGLLARTQMLEGDTAAAHALLAAAPPSSALQLVSASAYALDEDYAAASEAAQRAAQLEPQDWYVQNQAAHYLALNTDLQGAQQRFIEAERLLAELGEDAPLTGLREVVSSAMRVWWQVDEFKLGLEAGERLQGLGPMDTYNQSIYAELLQSNEQTEAALQAIALAIVAEPDVLSHQVFAAQRLVELDQADAAEKYLPLLDGGPGTDALKGYLLVILQRCAGARVVRNALTDVAIQAELDSLLSAHCAGS